MLSLLMCMSVVCWSITIGNGLYSTLLYSPQDMSSIYGTVLLLGRPQINIDFDGLLGWYGVDGAHTSPNQPTPCVHPPTINHCEWHILLSDSVCWLKMANPIKENDL